MPFIYEFRYLYYYETGWSNWGEEEILFKVGFFPIGEEARREKGLVDFLGEKIKEFLSIAIDDGGVGDPLVLKF